MALTGIVIAIILKIFRLHDFEDVPDFLFESLFITIGTIIIWEGNLQIDKWLNVYYPWVTETKMRILYQVYICFLYTAFTLIVSIFVGHKILDKPGFINHKEIDPLYYIGTIVSVLALTIEITTHFFNAWKKSLLEVERYKTESATAQLQNLKKQLNPHFLFNNLSVLTSLVYKNQDKAAEFISELSKVYRYALDNENTELVTLQNELEFIQHYIYLLSIRFDKGISFTINIEEHIKQSFLPPMCLQILIENTIQHNEISQSNPLEVAVYTKEQQLIIENPIHSRTDKTESSKTGIKNIQSRYSFFTAEKVEITHTENVFRIALPLTLHYESGNN